MPRYRGSGGSSRRRDESEPEDHPRMGRPGSAPKGEAGKSPETNRPPKGWGGHAGGPAGRHGPKGGRK